MRLYEVPQRLYDSEINFSISSFWDDGYKVKLFGVKLGDELNGHVAVARVESYALALAWLDEQARQHFPGSNYAADPLVP